MIEHTIPKTRPSGSKTQHTTHLQHISTVKNKQIIPTMGKYDENLENIK
jgi:hypothetical protein